MMKNTNENILYIVIEGMVGTGKTTQTKKLTEWLTNKYPDKDIVSTREPGGTEISEKIRKIVQGTTFEGGMDPVCEAYLYASSRAQSLRKVVKQQSAKKTVVVSDRSFLTSITNQGEARDLGVDAVLEINKKAIEGYAPDIVIYLDLDPKIGLSRTFDEGGDKFEKYGLDFYKKVQKGYEKAQTLKGIFGNWVNVDALGTEDEVFKRIKQGLQTYLK